MAEAFGLAASVLSVASLAIQLGDSLQKAYEFWESIEDGPDDIRRISAELRLLAKVLRSIEHDFNSGSMDTMQEYLVKDALEIAKKDIDALASVVAELSRAIRTDQTRLRRKWARVRIVLKGGTIAKMKDYVESSKSILNLLQASRTQSAVCQLNGKLDLLAASFSTTQIDARLITEDLPSPPPYQRSAITLVPAQREVWDNRSDQLSDSQTDPTDSRFLVKTSIQTVDAGLGVLTFRSTSAKISCRGAEENGESTTIKKTFTVNFLWRFATCRRGFRLRTSNTFDSWSFNTIRKRPADSRIFGLCISGNTLAVGELLRYGMASVFDADPHGATPLHYACRFGHSNLARLLIDRGADIYLRTDEGDAPITYLEEYDRYEDVKDRQNIANIVDMMIRYADFDPFDWEDRSASFDALTLWNGLPYENLRHVLSQNGFYATVEQRLDFILGNMLQLNGELESKQECIDILLVEYEKLRNNLPGGWRYNCTLLQHLVFHWLDPHEGLGRGLELKISRALKLTNDLWRRDREGTALDTVARYDGTRVDKWLKLLSANGIDVDTYSCYEQEQHPDGLIDQGPERCCRSIDVDFRLPEDGDDNLTIGVQNYCDVRYEHLNPEYRCGISRRRQLCISQLDDVFIGDDGKPLTSIPGSWTTTLKPNSELPVTLKYYEHGWQYTDFLEAPYRLWDGDESVAESQASSDFESSENDDGILGLMQKSPCSGWEAPAMIEEAFSKVSGKIPAFKSPCSGKETPI